MNIEEGLHDFLKTDSGVNALVGTKIFPLVAPDTAVPPYIVYQTITDPEEETHDGPAGIAHPRVQLANVADSYSAAKALRNAVYGALKGYKGLMGTVNVRHVKVVNKGFDDHEPETGRTRILMDAIIWYLEQ